MGRFAYRGRNLAHRLSGQTGRSGRAHGWPSLVALGILCPIKKLLQREIGTADRSRGRSPSVVGPHLIGAALSGVRLHIVLTGVQTGAPALLADAAEAAAALLYCFGTRSVHQRGRRWPGRQALAFGAGLVAIWVAVGSGLASYDETSVTLHMVQHILLMMAAPPLLALGRPVLLLTQAAPRRTQVAVARFMRGRLVSAATHPAFATPVYFATMWVMLVDRSVYDYLVSNQPVHELSHVVLLTVGLLYWPPLVAPDVSAHRLSFQARMLLLLGSMPLEALPGGWMRFQATPIDPINSLAGTHTAGEVFLVAATGACSIWLCTIAIQWFAFAVREERREAAKPTPTGWTVPWWAEPVPAASSGSSGDLEPGPSSTPWVR